MKGLRALFAWGTNLLQVHDQVSTSDREAEIGSEGSGALLVGISDFIAIHSRREEEDESGCGHEETCDITVMNEGVLYA